MANYFVLERRDMFRVLLCLIVLAAPLARAQDANAGQVLDEAGKSVAGAFVVVRWVGHVPNPLQSQRECYSMVIVRTDVDGKFKLPRQSPEGSGPLWRPTRYASIYFPGYMREIALSKGVTRLRKSDQPPLARLDTLLAVVQAPCVNPDRAKELAPIFKALYDEALSLGAPETPAVMEKIATLKELAKATSEGRWP